MHLYTYRLGENGKGFFIVEIHLQVVLSNNLKQVNPNNNKNLNRIKNPTW